MNDYRVFNDYYNMNRTNRQSQCNQRRLCGNEDCKVCLKRSFAFRPEAEFWSNKNELKPHQVFACSGKPYYFDCDKCDHTFEARLSNVLKGAWCPYCSDPPKKLCNDDGCKSCKLKSFDSHLKAKNWSKRNEMKARNVFSNSGEIYEFKCECGHYFKKSPRDVSRGRWCPYCSNPPKLLCENSKCLCCHQKSFASSPKKKYLSDRISIDPRNIFLGSGDKLEFKCEECHHYFKCSPHNISKGRWCPYCANPPQRLCDDKGCERCFGKSFASNTRSDNWSYLNTIKPTKVFTHSNKPYIFDCDVCNHTFETSPNRVSKGHWCPYCANQKLCSFEDCNSCFKKSFASHSKEGCWSENNKVSKRDVFLCAREKYEFICDRCNQSFKSALYSIASGCWCPWCRKKTEVKVKEWLLEEDYNIVAQPRFEWCKSKSTNNHLPFDFSIPDLKIIIELDGLQHFEQVSTWASPQTQRKNDVYKMDKANENGWTVIRLLQEDVWNDRIEWKHELKKFIKTRPRPINIFISSIPGIYRYHIFPWL